MEHIITQKEILAFERHLCREERGRGTREKYLREVRLFADWMGGEGVTKKNVAAWKEKLWDSGRSPGTVNGILAALHSFFAFLGWDECRVKYLKVQRQVFRKPDKELTQEEFFRLVRAAEEKHNRRLALLLETICATGIRVSELKYITVENLRRGRADISMKGKIRTILLPGKLVHKLQKYVRKQKITCGEIFITASGKGISRRQIWGEMKKLCACAGVARSKVFPHNLRHVFARAFYRVSRDIVKLADVLGHSSIETTRIYLVSTGEEHIRQLEKLGLVT